MEKITTIPRTKEDFLALQSEMDESEFMLHPAYGCVTCDEAESLDARKRAVKPV